MELPRPGGRVPLENESNVFAKPGARESDVTVGVVAIGGIDGPVGLMLCVSVVPLEEIDGLSSGFPVVVGGPGEILVGNVWRDTEEVVSLHQGAREGVEGNGLEIRRRGDELEDVIDIVLLDVGGTYFR